MRTHRMGLVLQLGQMGWGFAELARLGQMGWDFAELAGLGRKDSALPAAARSQWQKGWHSRIRTARQMG